MNLENRLNILMERLPPDIDAALICSEVNRRYYTGFFSSAGTLLATRTGCWFIIDARYHEAARGQIKSCEVVLQDRLYDQINDILGRQKVRRMALEEDKVSLSAFAEWKKRLAGIKFVGCDTLSAEIRAQRRRKSEEELRSIAQSQDITDKTFAHILNYIRQGRTEREIALEMEFYSRRIGSETVAFDFIVVSGKHSSLPHGTPSDKPVAEGDFITMDFGSVVDGYCSDMTRTVAVGRVSERQQEVYATVLAAQQAALAEIREGVACSKVDAAARNIIDAGPFKGSFGHSLGHSLGLEVHENPRFAQSSDAVSCLGDVMSVEPGIYLPGEFGVRIEDIVTVTQTGFHNFTQSPKELLIL